MFRRFRRLPGSVLISALLGCAAGRVPTEAPGLRESTSQIRVEVLTLEGKPLVEALVSAVPSSLEVRAGSATTGTDGVAQVPTVGREVVRVLVSGKTGNGTVTEAIDLPGPLPSQPVKVFLGRTARTAEVVGRIVDDRGQPVAGAKVHARLSGPVSLVDDRFRELFLHSEIATASTDAEGRFRVGSLRDHRTYALYVEAPGLRLLDRARLAYAGGVEVQLTLQPPPIPPRVTGRLLTPAGEPISRFFVGGFEMKDTLGRFEVEWLKELEFRARGLARKRIKVPRRRDQDLGDIRMEEYPTLTGTVVDAHGRAVSEARVEHRESGPETLTHTDGSGGFRLQVEQSLPVELEVSSHAGTSTVYVQDSRPVRVTLPPAGQISGTLPDGSPSELVFATCQRGLTRTGAVSHRRFLIQGVQGQCLVGGGRELAPAWVTVPEHGSASVELSPRKGPARLIAFLARPSHYAAVYLLPDDVLLHESQLHFDLGFASDGGEGMQTGEEEYLPFDGEVVDFRDLQPGLYTLIATDSRERGQVIERRRVEIRSGVQELLLDFGESPLN